MLCGVICSALVLGFSACASNSAPPAAPTPTPTPTARTVTYTSSAWGFSFRYPSPKYTVLDDQAIFKSQGALTIDRPLLTHDFLLIIASTAAGKAGNLWSSGVLSVYVDNMSRYKYLGNSSRARSLAPKGAAMFFNHVWHLRGFTLLDRTTATVGGRPAFRLLLVGKQNGMERAVVAYIVGTAAHVYFLVYSSPGRSVSASTKYRVECDSLISTFAFR